MTPAPESLPTHEIERRAALLIAFTHYHDNNAPMPETAIAHRQGTIDALVSEGLLYDDDGCYTITQRGIAQWWLVVHSWCDGRVISRLPTVLAKYDVEGRRVA